jgi:hypothetical protein
VNTTQQFLAFEKANRNKGFSTENLRGIFNTASYHHQRVIDFILPLLQRNEKGKVKAVIVLAMQALRSIDSTDGVLDVFRKAKVEGFPTPDSTLGYTWILEACDLAVDVYDPTSIVEEVEVPVLV